MELTLLGHRFGIYLTNLVHEETSREIMKEEERFGSEELAQRYLMY